MKFHVRYAIAFLILLAIEVFIALYVRDGFVRPYLGDVLVVWLIYCLLRTFCRVALLPLYIFMFAVVVEILQYFDIVSLLRLEGNTLARVIIGTSFSFLDLLCYLAGTLVLFGWQMLETKKPKSATD